MSGAVISRNTTQSIPYSQQIPNQRIILVLTKNAQ